MISRATVKPPKPESNTPIGALSNDALLFMGDHRRANRQVLVEPSSSFRRKVHATMGTVSIAVTRAAEARLPSGVMQANAVALERHPVLNLGFVILFTIGLVTDKRRGTLLVIQIVHTLGRSSICRRRTRDARSRIHQIVGSIVVADRLLRQVNVHIGSPVALARTVESSSGLFAGDIDGGGIAGAHSIKDRLGKGLRVYLPAIRTVGSGAHLAVGARPRARGAHGVPRSIRQPWCGRFQA